MSGFFEEGAERLELLLRVEVPGVEGVVRVRQRDFEFVLLLVEFRAFDLRDEQRLLRHRALAHAGEGHPVAVYGDSASGGGQRAGSGYNGGAQQQRQPQYDDPFASFWGAYGGNPYGNAGYGGYGQTRQDDSIEMRAAKNYIDTGHYAEALNALGSVPPGKRNARWYFLSALAQSGLHNNAQAMEYARQAASMEPSNMQYQQLLSQLQGGGSWYSQQGQEYGRRTGSMNSVCTTILMLNLCCACCGGGRMMYYPMFCCI